MESPLCLLCENFGDSEGFLCCEAFPQGIPLSLYPWGCVHRKPPGMAANGIGFKPKAGMGEVAEFWADFSLKGQDKSREVN